MARRHGARREEGKDGAARGRMVPVDAKTAVSLVRSRIPLGMDFGMVVDSLGGPLESLGATPEQKEKVVAVLKDARARMDAIEQRTVKVVPLDQAGPVRNIKGGFAAPGTALVLDLRAALPEAEKMIKATKDELIGVLDPGAGLAFAEGLPWSGILGACNNEPQVSLQVLRDGRGNLRAVIRGDVFSYDVLIRGLHTNDEAFPKTGPLAADKIFGERWAPLLKGMMITPQE